jgi:hypothetical protein
MENEVGKRMRDQQLNAQHQKSHREGVATRLKRLEAMLEHLPQAVAAAVLAERQQAAERQKEDRR